jgi:7-cyano-7-deazaguanine synthase
VKTQRESPSNVARPKPSVLVLLSGGIDSAATAAFYAKAGFDVRGLHIDFGQAARREEQASSTRVADYLGIELISLKIRGLTPPDKPGALIGRNAMFLFAALTASGLDTDVIASGVHSSAGWVDCSVPFVSAVQAAFDLYTGGIVRVGAPFIDWSKREIMKQAQDAGIPLDITYSCDRRRGPCGECRSCRDIALASA